MVNMASAPRSPKRIVVDSRVNLATAVLLVLAPTKARIEAIAIAIAHGAVSITVLFPSTKRTAT